MQQTYLPQVCFQQPCFYQPYFPIYAYQTLPLQMCIPFAQIQPQNKQIQQVDITKQNVLDQNEQPIRKKENTDDDESKLNNTPPIQSIFQTTQSKSLKANLLTESTNVHKNFAKAIIQFILRSKSIVFKFLGEEKGKHFLDLMHYLRNNLGNLNHIIRFTNDEEFLKVFRILSYKFYKRESVTYIYSSKIQHKTNHLKTRSSIVKSIRKY